ncbi:MAG: MATE family efflux transporter [Actinomycetota bacterium]|nr:MAG: MATE family efflux transporter [Actinomycetota bacterium]
MDPCDPWCFHGPDGPDMTDDLFRHRDLRELLKDHFSDPTWRRIVRLGLPSLGSVLLSPIYAATDSAIMGHVGKIPLAALALAMGFLNFWVLPFTSVGFAITSRAAFYSGSGDLQSRNNLGISSAAAMGIFGLILGILFAAAAPFVAPLLTHSQPIARSTTEYLQLAAIGVPALFVFQAGSMFLTGTGHTGRVLTVTALNVGVNILLEVVLVFGAHLSVAGSALGTDIAEIVGAAVMILIMRHPGPFIGLAAKVLDFFREFFPAGAALAVRTFALVGALSGLVFVASQGTPEVLDSFQVGQQVWLVFGLSFDAVAVPAQVLVGEWLATGQLRRMKHWTSRLLHIGWIGGIGLAAIVVLARGPIVGLFTNIPSVSGPARASVAFAGLAMPVTALSFVIDGLVGGFQRYQLLRTIMLISFVTAAVFAIVVLIVRGSSLSIVDVWIIFGSWLLVRGIASLVAWRKLLASHA